METVFTGTVSDLLKKFIEEIKRQLDDNTLSFEEIHYNINIILDLFEELEKDEAICDKSRVIITVHPMGSFIYELEGDEE